MLKLNKRSLAVVASATAILTVGGVAYAYYLTGVAATGTGSAITAANTSVDITYAASQVTGLVPGGTQNATVTVTNPNAWAVNYGAKTISVTGVVTNGLCTTAKALLSGSVGLPAGVLAASGTTTLTLPITMADSTTVDQTDCANKTLTVNLGAA